MSSCTPGYAAVARSLDGGLDCTSAEPLVSMHPPWELTNWTLPVVEALMVLGAIATLVHAVLWWRRRRDPVNLAVWFASVVYVLVLEPPLYFPDRFGLQEQVGLIFVHNRFSVQFLYDRLPLYILALYPAMTYLAFVLVRGTGVLDRRRAWVGAACVALTFHVFYEIFDQLGPQLRWWAWNPAAPSNSPLLGSAPLSSAAIFAGASPFGFALLTQLLITRRVARGPVPVLSLCVRVIGVGALTPLFMMAFAIPYGIAGRLSPPSASLEAVSLWAVIASMLVVAGAAFTREARDRVPGTATAPGSGAGPTSRFDQVVVISAAVYLCTFTLLWGTALPDYLAATGGHIQAGPPIGNLVYTVLCAAGACAVVLLAFQRSRRSVPSDRPAPLAASIG